MIKISIRFLLVLTFYFSKAQTVYFPPITGTTWDTLSPASLNWCQPRIDSLINYLQVKNTKSFIILHNGKIVLEKYFGTYTKDSIWYWASAGKSLTGFLAGIAQQKGLININSKVSQYIGTGWTNAPLLKENLISVKNLLQMTSGLDDTPPLPCGNEDTAKACLVYLANADTRWAYHTGPYKKTQDVISSAAGQSYNVVTSNWVKNKIGMDGFWFEQVYYSKARSMARFGLLNLNKGIWANDTILKDSLYFKDMINSSQNYNKAYGYLWWLNGKTDFMTPGNQLVFNGSLIPNAPSDMYAALGKNDQKIYVVPGQKLVVVRQGNTAGGFNLAASAFDNVLWDYINKLVCSAVSINETEFSQKIKVYPNPANAVVNIDSDIPIRSVILSNSVGEIFDGKYFNHCIDISELKKGMYLLTLTTESNARVVKKIIIQ